MPIMLSYSRKDEVVVKGLARDLEAAKREVWFDHNLIGGDAWWDSILANIRQANVLIFALSDASLHSKPCRLELDYALDLGRPIVPVRVGPVLSLRASPLAALQIIDYSPDAARSGFAVLAAVDDAARRERPLPDPLPPPPPIPFAYLFAIGRQIESAELSLTDQIAAVDQLRRALGEETDESVRRDILTMLTNLNSKPWTARRTEREIAAVLYAHAPELLPDEDEDRTITRRMRRPQSAQPAEPAGTPAPSPPRTAEPHPRAAQPAPHVAEPGSHAAQPGPHVAEPGSHAAQPGPHVAEPGPHVAEPGPHAAQPDPREWFAERLEQLQRQRVAAEVTADPDPPPWRLSADAAALWRRTFGRETDPWAAAGAAPSGSWPGPTSTPPPEFRPPPPYFGAPGPQHPTAQPAGPQHPTAQPAGPQHPTAQPAGPQPSSRQPPDGPAPPADSNPAPDTQTTPPPDYWRMSTFSCLLPPWLFGRMARRYSRQVRQRYLAGDVAGARIASGKARTWAVFGIVVGSLVLLALVLLV